MKIAVKYQQKSEPITVYGGWIEDEDFLIDWCNHAGAEEKPDNGIQVQYKDGDIDVVDVASWLKVCDKCHAYFDPRYGMWEDA